MQRSDKLVSLLLSHIKRHSLGFRHRSMTYAHLLVRNIVCTENRTKKNKCIKSILLTLLWIHIIYMCVCECIQYGVYYIECYNNFFLLQLHLGILDYIIPSDLFLIGNVRLQQEKWTGEKADTHTKLQFYNYTGKLNLFNVFIFRANRTTTGEI